MATPDGLGWIWWTWGMATMARYGHHYYIVRAMRLHGASCSNHFVARLSNLGITIAFCPPHCLSPTHIL